MKSFSIPKISIPNVSIPNISIGSGGIDAGSITSAISSAIPDLSNITSGLNLEGVATDLVSDAISEGVEIPSELKGLLK